MSDLTQISGQIEAGHGPAAGLLWPLSCDEPTIFEILLSWRLRFFPGFRFS